MVAQRHVHGIRTQDENITNIIIILNMQKTEAGATILLVVTQQTSITECPHIMLWLTHEHCQTTRI